jgi:signal transduction histidine kinase
VSSQLLRILLVEDDDDHAELVLGLLEDVRRPAIEAVRVKTVAQAVERLDTGPVDAVLLDQKLPDSDFWETVPRVVEAAPRLPILVLTSLNDLDLALEAVNQGAQDYLVKSELSADALLRALRYAIERKRYGAAAEQSRTVMGLFAHAVAHEIKAPLAAARLQMDLARAEMIDAGVAERARLHLEKAEEMVVRTAALIADLLSFGVVSAGKEPVAFRTIVQEALDELEPDIAATGAHIRVGDMPTLPADRTKLRQLFVNLFANALKYRREGVPPEIVVSAEPEGAEAWRFSVADSGVGMETEDLERVFGLFQRGRDPSRPGSGLGLALCRQIVEGHGGNIWAESQPGAGTAIRFTLPSSPGTPAAVATGVEELDESLEGIG